jgi:vitamin B12 transporter
MPVFAGKTGRFFLPEKTGEDKPGGCHAMRKTVLFSTAVFIVLFRPLSAEDPKKQTGPPPLQHEVVVTATRIETPAREIASSVTVITGSDLEKTKKPMVLEALQGVMGLAVIQNGGLGSASSAFLRGANSEHILILLDGVEVNDPMNPSRSYDLAHLSVDNVEQIEILRGPQSTLYGSDALGGVINILTKKGQGKPRLTLSTQGGAYKTLSSALEFSGSSGTLNYSLGLSRLSTEGISAAGTAYSGNKEKDGYKNLSLSGRIGLNLKKNIGADFIIRSAAARSEIDNFGGPWGDDPNSTQNYNSFLFRGQVRGLFVQNRWEQKLGISYVRSSREHDNPVDEFHPYDAEKGMFKSNLMKLDWQNNIFIREDNTLTFGADISREEGESEYTSFSILGPYESPFPSKKADKKGIYIQDQIRVAGRFFATLGARLDHHSRAGTALTYRLAPAYFLERTQTKFKATIGTGFKAPSLYQLYAPGTFWGPIGNVELKPEESRGWDIGVEQYFLKGTVLAGMTYFRDDLRNLVDFDFSLGYINVGRARTRGVELYGEARVGDNLQCRASYTSLEAKDLDDGTDLLRRPRDKFTARIDGVFLKKWAASLSAAYTGQRADKDFSAWISRDVTLPSYWLLDASLSFSVNARAQFFVRLDNILNAKYETVFGYGAPGFAVYGGFKVGFLN